jgi:GTP cyclohydrolase I
MKLTIDDDLFNVEELENTPRRYKKFIEEWKQKHKEFNFTVFEIPKTSKNKYDEMVGINDITFNSLCAHHLLPFSGKACIAYIPNKKICGASKLIRALEMFANKPQTQEKLTIEVADYLMEKLQPHGLGIILSAGHDCMRIRGVKNPSSMMFTSALRGCFKTDNKTRDEFLRMSGR